MTRQAVTKHLATLADAGLVESERRGRETRYRLTVAGRGVGRPARRAAHAPEPPAPLTRTARPPSRVRHDEGVEGIRLAGLRKTYATPTGRVEAVRGLDLEVPPGQTVALLGPNGAGKSTTIDMLLGLLPPDEGTVSIFGAAPSEAIAAGAVGAMLQTGGLLRDLTVRELVAMMGSLYPSRSRSTQALERRADRRHRRAPNREALGRRDAAGPVRDRARQRSRPARARRADGRHGRRDEAHVLADGARVRGARQDGALCDALPRGGGRLCRPRRAGRPRRRRRRRRAHDDQVDGRAPAHPRDARRGAGGRTAAIDGVEHVERRGASVELACSDSDAALRGLLRAYPQARDIEVTGAGLEEAFLQLTGDEVERA